MSTKVNWLDRHAILAPFMTLATSREEFKAAQEHLMLKDDEFQEYNPTGATTHTYECDGKISVIIQMDLAVAKSHSMVAVFGLLLHEAVHIWQGMLDDMGEKNPGREIEAYSIQSITQTLVWEMEERLKPKKKAAKKATKKDTATVVPIRGSHYNEDDLK